MKIMIDVTKQPTEDCVLVFDGKQYKPVKKEVFLDMCFINSAKIKELEERIKSVENELAFNRGE